MNINVNSDEFKAWHEVGHATVCLQLGGDLESIEFLEGDERGFAVAHCCDVTPEIERSVACGGFAAEYFLVKNRYVDRVDEKEISAIAFGNAWRDRLEFVRRKVTQENDFTAEEDWAFMNHAIQYAAPIVEQNFLRMQNVVKELLATRHLDGQRVKELLRPSAPIAMQEQS